MQASKCGDRRCTIEEAELELKGYRDRYVSCFGPSKSTTIDALPPNETRIKTELEEAGELLEKAKHRGAKAWSEFEEGIQTALNALGAAFHTHAKEEK